MDFLRIPCAAEALLDGGAVDDQLHVAVELDAARHVEDPDARVVGHDRFDDRAGVVIVKKRERSDLRHD